jgi:hypothetical protein
MRRAITPCRITEGSHRETALEEKLAAIKTAGT